MYSQADGGAKAGLTSKPQHKGFQAKTRTGIQKGSLMVRGHMLPCQKRRVRDKRSICMGCAQHTWDAVNLHASLLKVLKLLTTAAKDVGIATLEPHNCSVVLRKLTQELMDLILCPRMEGALFAHIHHPGAIVYELQDVSRDQPATKRPCLRSRTSSALANLNQLKVNGVASVSPCCSWANPFVRAHC